MLQRPQFTAPVWALIGLALPLSSVAGFPRFQATGELRGVIVNASTQRPLAGVEVSFVQIDFSARTDSLGRYAILNIPAGRYTLLIKGEGFKPALATKHMLFGDSVNVLDFALEQLPAAEPDAPPEDDAEPDYWAEVLPGSTLQRNTNLIVAIRGSLTGFRMQQRRMAVTGVSREPPARSMTRSPDPSFIWVIDGRTVSETRAATINTSDVTCVEIRRGVDAIQRFARTVPPGVEARGTDSHQGVVLIWTRGSRTPMPVACTEP